MRWQTDLVTEAIAELGGRKIDRFDIPTAGMPQPTERKCKACDGSGFDEAKMGSVIIAERSCRTCLGRKRIPIVQRTSRGKHSTLLAFAKPKGRPG